MDLDRLGFQHPSAVYWHCAVPMNVNRDSGRVAGSEADSSVASLGRDDHPYRIVTYREMVQNGLSPRMLGQAIAERTGRERISEIFLSPDAFAHRTSESSIAEQLGDVFILNGLPRPAAADDDRIGGWQLMYQLLESNAWVITENCAKLIERLPLLVRDNTRVEDIHKSDGDDPADAARYGLVSGGRLAGVGAGHFPFVEARPGRLHGRPHLMEQSQGRASALEAERTRPRLGRISSPACPSMSRFGARSARLIRHRKRFTTSDWKAKRKSFFGRSRSQAAAAGDLIISDASLSERTGD
jgi:hypothetical protein